MGWELFRYRRARYNTKRAVVRNIGRSSRMDIIEPLSGVEKESKLIL